MLVELLELCLGGTACGLIGAQCGLEAREDLLVELTRAGGGHDLLLLLMV